MPRPILLLAVLALWGSTACSRPPTSLGSAALSERAEEGRVVLGAPGDPAVTALLEVLAPGVILEEQQWAIDGYRSPRRGALLVAVLEDPDRPGFPVTLAVSDEPTLLTEAEPRLGGGWRPCVELWRVGHREVVARLTGKGKLRADTIEVREFEEGMVADVLRHASGLEVRYFIDARISVERLDAYVTEVVEAVGRASWAELELPRSLQVVARVEGDRLGFVDPASGALAVTLAGSLDDGGAAYVEHLLRQKLGAPSEERIGSLASAGAAGELFGVDLAGDRHAYPFGFEPPLFDVLPWLETSSSFDKLGSWTGSDETEGPRIELESAFEPWPAREIQRDGPIIGELEDRYVRIHVPAGGEVQDGGPWRRSDVTLEGDVRNLCRIARARASSHRVVVELVFVSSPSTSFDGDRVLTTVAEWREHLAGRRDAALRVAGFCQILRVPVFLIGAGPLRSARTAWSRSGEEPEALRALREARLAGWTDLITGVREIYGGDVGYVADLDQRAADIGFWDQLDLVGLRIGTPPLARRTGTRNRFTGNLTWGAEFAASHGRPTLHASTEPAAAYVKPALFLAPGLDRARRDALIDAWERADERLRGAGLLIGDLDPDQAERLR